MFNIIGTTMENYWARELSRIRNPLFKFDKRPEILEILYTDCINSFVRDARVTIDPFKTQCEKLADLTMPTTPEELCTFYVK